MAVSERALASGALIPLDTELLDPAGIEPFVLRQLLSRPPRHLAPGGPKPNPFLPWDPPLQVALLASGHVLLLNKFPVQRAHLLVITQQWQPQSGWLGPLDWQAVATVSADTGGLWFFNSSATAGASQPHRHLQLLPRHEAESSCPMASRIEAQLLGEAPLWPWAYRLSRRRTPASAEELSELYRSHCDDLGLGQPSQNPSPAHAYNLVFNDHWFLTVRRVREHQAGFSINGLGFAGYLLCTDHSDRRWLASHGPWALLEAVAAEHSVIPRLRCVDP
ncbi:MAG: ATP adenylyltransferase [Cyanobium sp.]